MAFPPPGMRPPLKPEQMREDNTMICFSDFDKKLLGFLIRYIIMSKETQKNHKFKDGEFVFYYDGCFSNIHRLDLKEYKDLHQEVLDNTKYYNEGKEWDLLTGIYFYLPGNKKVVEIIDNSKEICKGK